LACPIPVLVNQETATLDLFLRIFGKLNEDLLIPLGAQIEIYKNVEVTGSITTESGFIIQTIDSMVKVLGSGLR